MRARPSGDTSPGCPWVGAWRPIEGRQVRAGSRAAPRVGARGRSLLPEGLQRRGYPHPRRSAPSPPSRRPVRQPIRWHRWSPGPKAPPRAGAPPANGRPSAGSQCAQPARSRLRARKANLTRRGRCSGPAAAAAAAAAAASSPRIGCTVPTRKSSSAARQRRASAMTQEYDK